ncbi:MAG: DUF5990 family protein [Chloroflexi bacterium]|nr:DUF5990 family protein [Chloroflexota bacterium]MCC6896930.1 hypothetical protein [Anaerolineae bacterium]
MPPTKQPLQLQIVCYNRPPAEFNGMPAARFGLQDKQGALDIGQPQPDGSRLFTCTIEGKTSGSDVDFSGSHVQGAKGARFLYLSWAYDTGGWVQRIKIPLQGITADQIKRGQSLQVIIENGCASGSVKLPNGWKTV